MYRVNVLDGGKFNNVKTGYRYTITKRNAKKFLKHVVQWGCDFEVEKFIYISSGIFVWADVFYDDEWLDFLDELEEEISKNT